MRYIFSLKKLPFNKLNTNFNYFYKVEFTNAHPLSLQTISGFSFINFMNFDKKIMTHETFQELKNIKKFVLRKKYFKYIKLPKNCLCKKFKSL